MDTSDKTGDEADTERGVPMGKKMAARVIRQAEPLGRAGRTTSWRDAAACFGTDPEVFFPVSSSGPAQADVVAAKRLCGQCPVKVACLRWALDHGVTAGVWGGTTEEERRLLRGRVPLPR